MKLADQLAKLLAEQRNKDILLSLEIKIDRTVSDSGRFRNPGNLRTVKSVFGEDFDRCFEDLGIFFLFSDLPWNHLGAKM